MNTTTIPVTPSRYANLPIGKRLGRYARMAVVTPIAGAIGGLSVAVGFPLFVAGGALMVGGDAALNVAKDPFTAEPASKMGYKVGPFNCIVPTKYGKAKANGSIIDITPEAEAAMRNSTGDVHKEEGSRIDDAQPTGALNPAVANA